MGKARASDSLLSPVWFEQPLAEGWVYPCTLADMQHRLAQLPAQDVAGLHTVGLATSTRKDCYANGRYFSAPAPRIHLYSYPASLVVKMPPHVKRSHIEQHLAVELRYGMEVEQAGSRWLCRWQAQALRRFILIHVLAHEVGHHVYYCHRQAQRLVYRPRTMESEQFAEAYAARQATATRPTSVDGSGRWP